MNGATVAFTKGPWLAGVQYDDEFGCPVVAKSRGEVAEAKGSSEEECAANARLIAAAPLMYATLSDVYSIAKREGLESVAQTIREVLLAAEAG